MTEIFNLHDIYRYIAKQVEVLKLIFSYLDLQSLCAMARVSVFFNTTCKDPLL